MNEVVNAASGLLNRIAAIHCLYCERCVIAIGVSREQQESIRVSPDTCQAEHDRKRHQDTRLGLQVFKTTSGFRRDENLSLS